MSVSVSHTVFIKDACIFFDLIDLDLLTLFYQLRLKVITTPEVLDEIEDEMQFRKINNYIESGQLEIDNLGVLESITLITDANSGLSYTDASVLEAASRHNADILSSDKSLRSEAARRSLSVRGLLWILEQLYQQKLIEKSLLTEKLETYQKINCRAPKVEIESLIKKYKH